MSPGENLRSIERLVFRRWRWARCPRRCWPRVSGEAGWLSAWCLCLTQHHVVAGGRSLWMSACPAARRRSWPVASSESGQRRRFCKKCRLRFTRWTFTMDAQHIEPLKARSASIARVGERSPKARRRCRRGSSGAPAAQGAAREVVEDPVSGWEFVATPDEVPVDRLMNVPGSPGFRFRACDAADFGWGRPRRAAVRRTENVKMKQDGQVALVRVGDGDGVQVSVSMLRRTMDAFKSRDDDRWDNDDVQNVRRR